MMVDIKKIGERIAMLRKERGMTAEKFAELLDVSMQAVSKWETGKNLPETALLPSISKLLGVTIDSILVPQLYPVRLFMGGHYIDGLSRLQYGKFRDCTWAGSIKLLLDAIGVNMTYSEIMGFSGACYHFAMTPNWCPSATMPQIIFDPAIYIEQAVGVEHVHYSIEDRDSKIKEAIRRGMPVMMIEPRVEMEWGVLCGYTGDGRFFGRSYFDYLKPDRKDIFTDNEYYLADRYPGSNPNLIYFLSNRTKPLPLNESLRLSLENAHRLYTANPTCDGQYVFGLSAYDLMINDLQCDDPEFSAISQYGTTENGVILLSHLIDARRAARDFWSLKSVYLSARNEHKMCDVIGLYGSIVSALEVLLPNDLINSVRNGYPSTAWSKETRIQLADTLSNCKHFEQQILNNITDILKHW